MVQEFDSEREEAAVRQVTAQSVNSWQGEQGTTSQENERAKPLRLLPLKRRDGAVVAFTLLDAEDFDHFSQWTWRLSTRGYAKRGETRDGKKRTIYLHGEINGTPDSMVTDHINGRRLDNRRCNLRTATTRQNNANSARRKRKSKYRGVYWHSKADKWVAQISVKGKLKHLGLFEVEEDAALAYNGAAQMHHGEFARLNQPHSSKAA